MNLRDDAHTAFVQAAIVLATIVDVDDRIASDPSFRADRSPRASEIRAQHMTEALASFREVRARFAS